MTTRRERLAVEARVWFGVLAGALAWATQHVFGYAVTEAACDATGGQWGVPIATLNGIAGALAAAIAIAGLVVAIGVFRGNKDGAPPPEGRRHFLGAIGIAVNPLFAAIALMSGMGAIALEDCAQAAPRAGVVRPEVERGLAPVELGRQLFAGNCASCHGSRAEGIASAPSGRGSGGVTGLGPSLLGVGAQALDFYLRTGRMPLDQPDEQPERQRPVFSDHEIRSIIAYVDSLKPGPPVPDPHPESGAVNNGLHLFTDHCAGCHQIQARGGVVTGARVPSLQDASATQIAEAVRIGPYLMPKFSSRDISDRELDSIIRYVLSTRSPPDRGGWGIGHIGPIPEGAIAWLLAGTLLVLICVGLGRRFKA